MPAQQRLGSLPGRRRPAEVQVYGDGGVSSVRQPVPIPTRLGSGQRHAASRLPGTVPDHLKLHHLGLRARPDHLREDSATIYAAPTLAIIMSWLILGQVSRWLPPPWQRSVG